MKKQKLHPLAKIAAISLVGTFPLFGLSESKAQEVLPMPPIVQPTPASATAGSSYYAGAAPKLLAPVRVGGSSQIAPPIVSSRPGIVEKATQAAGQASQNLLAPIGSGIKQVKGTYDPMKVSRAFSPAKMPVLTQGSGSRGIAPAIQIPSPSSVLSNGPSAPVISGSLVTQDSMPSVLNNQPIASPNYFDSPQFSNNVQLPSVVSSGCVQCGGAEGGCPSCEQNGQAGLAGNPNVNQNQVNCDYGTYGSVSAARRYAHLEFLYLTREDGDLNLSNFNPLGEFDFNASYRFTIGQRPDRTQGRELTYFGTSGIENAQTTNNADNRLNALFTPVGGIIPSDLSAFTNAFQQTQFKRTNIQSVELNKVRWGWDVLKSFVGFRYIHLSDRFELESTAFRQDAFGNFLPDTEEGRFRLDTLNNLVGGHLGAELFYDIGYRFSISGVSKYGVYANINSVDNFFENDGTVLLDTENEDATISTTYEIDLLAHYQIRQTARLRLGYKAIFLGNLATAADNVSPFVNPLSGFDTSDNDDAFIHGVSFGLEIYR